jgi:hypothetical protein
VRASASPFSACATPRFNSLLTVPCDLAVVKQTCNYDDQEEVLVAGYKSHMVAKIFVCQHQIRKAKGDRFLNKLPVCATRENMLDLGSPSRKEELMESIGTAMGPLLNDDESELIPLVTECLIDKATTPLYRKRKDADGKETDQFDEIAGIPKRASVVGAPKFKNLTWRFSYFSHLMEQVEEKLRAGWKKAFHEDTETDPSMHAPLPPRPTHKVPLLCEEDSVPTNSLIADARKKRWIYLVEFAGHLYKSTEFPTFNAATAHIYIGKYLLGCNEDGFVGGVPGSVQLRALRSLLKLIGQDLLADDQGEAFLGAHLGKVDAIVSGGCSDKGGANDVRAQLRGLVRGPCDEGKWV